MQAEVIVSSFGKAALTWNLRLWDSVAPTRDQSIIVDLHEQKANIKKNLLGSCHVSCLMAALQDKTCLMIHQLRSFLKNTAHAAGPALIDGLS